MKLSFFACVVLASATTAFAQIEPTSQAASTKPDTQTLTLTGCVTAGASATDPFTLASPSIVKMGSTPTALPSSAAAATAGASSAGTTGSVTGAVSPAGSGSSGTTASGAAVTGTPPAADLTAFAAASSPTGYRLSGADVSAYAGKRVQIVGALVPSPNAAATAGATSSGVGGATGTTGVANPIGVGVLPEFKVVTITPIAGPCSPR